MNRLEFERHLKDNTLPRAVMLYGESHFFIDRYSARMIDPEHSLVRLYHDEYTLALAKAHLSQGSLFASGNTLLIKTEKKLPKSDLDTLIQLIRHHPHTRLIYAYYGSEMRGVDTSFRGEACTSVRLYPPYPNEARAILLQEARERAIDLEPHLASELLTIHHHDLSLACNELDKLALLPGRLSTRDLHTHISALTQIKLDQFLTLILEKKPFTPALRPLLSRGEDPIRILTALTQLWTQLYLFHTSIKVHGTIDTQSLLGYRLPSNIEKERTAKAITFSLPTYTTILTLLLRSELEMKSSGHPDTEALLIATLLEVQRRL